ncbi:MAG: TIR domain-containing protein [Steroidobacteraceae bacterium]
MPRDVFVSHASEDHALAEQVCALLEQRGLKCWIAPRDVGAGAEWDEAILDAIERSRAYLLILSAHANRSSFVKNELNRAFSVKKPIVTFRIEDVLPGRSLELYLARHHWTDAFPPPLEPRVDQLASSLTRLLNPVADGEVNAPSVSVIPVPKPAHITALVSRIAGLARRRVSMAAFAIAVVGMIAFAVPALNHLRETPPPEMRTEINTPATDQPAMFALSPDGRQIAFVASGDGASRLWLRSLATTTAQPLPGTDGATYPFWSPDGRSVAFFAGGALKRLDLSGAAPQTLAPAAAGRGGTWSADGVILFAPNNGANPLMRVGASGGAVVAATTLGPQQLLHIHPQFLPDGRRFLFYVTGNQDTAGIYVGALDGGAPTRLTLAESPGAYLASGWLLWVRSGTLVAQRLDLDKAVLTGEPVTLADGVASDTSTWRNAVSVAATGLLAYRTGGSSRQLTWFDRSGTARGTVGDADSSLFQPRVSPDGRRVVVYRTVQGNRDLWLLDGARTTRFTFDPANDDRPIWSPDGTRIVFRSYRSGRGDLYQKLANGTGVEERLVGSDRILTPSSWSPDGRFLMYQTDDPQTAADLWVVPMTGEPTPSVFLQTPFRETYAAFSPDGRWVAYHSNESGRNEVYVRPFVVPGATDNTAVGQLQVSTAGGITPMWAPGGKELYYLNPAGDMMAAPITVTGTALQPGAPVKLFPSRIMGGGVDRQLGRQYDVAPDGRFLINTEVDGGDAAPITLLMNWNPQAKPQ